MKKVLSVALAMVFALSSAAMVSALSEEGFEYLAKLGMKKEEKKEEALYEAWASKKEYEALRDQLLKADKALKADSKEWAKLQTIACEALRKAKEVENELKSVETLKAVAEDTVAVDFPLTTNITKDNTAVLVSKADAKALKELKAELDKIPANDEKAEEKVSGRIVGVRLVADKDAVTNNQLRELVTKDIEKLYKKVMDKGYQDARSYAVENYSTDVANKTVARLEAQKMHFMGVVKFVGEVAKKTGLAFTACAIPSDVTPAPAAKTEAKKDMVPNTAAAFGCAL